MNGLRRFCLAFAISMGLAGCAENQTNALTGTAIGATAGGLFGTAVAGNNRFLGGAIGAGLGGAVGNVIGRRLDAESEARRQAALQQASLQPMRDAGWSEAKQQTSGTVRFRQPPRVASNGRRCAPVVETVMIGGQPQQVDSTMCQQANGQWSAS
jgi:surface antigen